MNTESIEISRWLRAGIVGIALSLATVQTAGADTLRPTVDTGGPGGGTSSADVYYELEYEQGRPVVVEQADSQSAELTAYERAQVWPNFNLESTVAQQPNTSEQEDEFYAIAHEHGNGTFAEQSAVEAAGQEAQAWPNFDSTRIVVQQPITSMLESGSYVIVDNQGNGSVPEQATSQTDPSAEARRAMAANENLRSILMIEGKEVANDSTAPAFAVHPNLRLIELIEGKQALAEVAQPALVSAYAICLACSSFG